MDKETITGCRFILSILVALGASCCADDECKVCPPATPAHYQHRTLTAAELKPILALHQQWLIDNDRDDERLRQHWNDPRRADLSGADLSGLPEEEQQADQAVLVKADLEWVDFHDANLVNVDLNGSDLTGANFSRADLEGTIISEADLSEANLACALFEPAPGGAGSSNGLPKIGSLALAQNFCLLSYRDSPHALAALREALQKSGDRDQERQVTFALNYEGRRRSMGHLRVNAPQDKPQTTWLGAFIKDESGFFSGLFNWSAFELTSAYGLRPGRPLNLLLLLILICAIPYAVAITHPRGGAIYKVWPKDGLEGKEKDPEAVQYPLRASRPHADLYNIAKFALFFSTAAAFQIGWHDLNVGNWIDRLHAHEYVLRAVGWPRTLAGIQAIVSAFLLALWALSYFARPFG